LGAAWNRRGRANSGYRNVAQTARNRSQNRRKIIGRTVTGDGGAPSPAAGAEFAREWQAFTAAVEHAAAAGLTVNAGHGLHYANTARIAQLPAIHELNIGHAIVARAMAVGFPAAVAEMKRLMAAARSATPAA